MLLFLLLFSTFSETAESLYPTAMLIDESSEQTWRPYKIDRSGWTASGHC